MPKYNKTTKIELWKNADQWQDERGAWHAGRGRQVASFWANFKGRNNSLVFDQTGQWGEHTVDFTISRPKWQRPELGDHIRYDGRFYRVTAINDLTGQVGHDMRITCADDPDYNTEG